MFINSAISPANLLGCLSLFTYIFTLLPSCLRISIPAVKKARFIVNLLKYRRQLGILAFLVALVHVVLIVIKRNVDLFDLQTYSISVEGTASLIIFALLAFTSNDWSVKKMKKNWRRLHQLTYTAIFLLFWHIQEKMSGHWNLLTPVELIFMTIIMALFLKRRWLEYQKESQQQAINFHESTKGLCMEKTSFTPNFQHFSYKMICSCEFFILLSLAILGLVKFNLNINSQSNANVIILNHKTLNINGLRVYSVAISPDGKTIANGNLNKDIDVWNLKTGKIIHKLCGHENSVNSVAISPDSKIIASGSWDHNIKLWNLQTGQLIRTLSGHLDDVKSVVFSPNGKILASSSWDKTVKLWNIETGEIIRTFQQSDEVRTVAISPDGKIMASAGESGKIMLWHISTGKIRTPLAAHEQPIWSIAISPDGKYLASGSSDHTIRLWNIQTGELSQSLVGHDKAVYSVVFSPNGQTLASGSYDHNIKLWNVENGKLINTLNGHKKAVWSLAFSPNQQILISGSADATIKLWSLSSEITNIKSSFDSQVDNFRQAVNAAINAANLTQTATSLPEWQQVVNNWQQAIKLMQTIPVSSIHYPVAQKKMIEYQHNLHYAHKNTLLSKK